jgi:hypothetical protein
MSVPPSDRVVKRFLFESERNDLGRIFREVSEILNKVPEPVTGSLQNFRSMVQDFPLETCKGEDVYELREAIKKLRDDSVVLESWKPLERLTSFANELQVRYSVPSLEISLQEGQHHLQLTTCAIDTTTGDLVIKNSIMLDPHSRKRSLLSRRIDSIGWSFQDREEVNTRDLWSWLRNTQGMLSELRSMKENAPDPMSEDSAVERKFHDISVSALGTLERSLRLASISRRDPTFKCSIPPKEENAKELLSESDSEKIAQSLSGMITLLETLWDEVFNSATSRESFTPAGLIIKKWNPRCDTGQAVKRLATSKTGCGGQSSTEDFGILYKLLEKTADVCGVAAFSERYDPHGTQPLERLVKKCKKRCENLLEPKDFVEQFRENLGTVCKAIKEVSGMSIDLAAYHEIDPDGIPTGSLGPNSFYTVSCNDVVRQKPLARGRGSRYMGNVSLFENGGTLAWPCPLPNGELDRLTQEMTSFLHSLNADADSLRKLQTAVKQQSSLESQSSLGTDLDQQTRNNFSTILSTVDASLLAAMDKASTEESKASSVPPSTGGKRKRKASSGQGTPAQS